MVTLYQLAKMAEPGEQIRWKGEETDVEKPRPREVTRIIHEKGEITVEAEGPQGGQARFHVEEGRDSKAWYGPNDEHDMGPVDKAELVDKNTFTEPWSTSD